MSGRKVELSNEVKRLLPELGERIVSVPGTIQGAQRALIRRELAENLLSGICEKLPAAPVAGKARTTVEIPSESKSGAQRPVMDVAVASKSSDSRTISVVIAFTSRAPAARATIVIPEDSRGTWHVKAVLVL